jgi:hypothetical protein
MGSISNRQARALPRIFFRPEPQSDTSFRFLRGTVSENPQRDWVELYRAAVVELDAALLHERIQQASLAIHDRIRELLPDSNHHEERQALQDALQMLRILHKELE